MPSEMLKTRCDKMGGALSYHDGERPLCVPKT